MGVQVISSHILVESPASETDEQFCAAIECMVLQAYGHQPDWLRFTAGAASTVGDRHFRELVCFAGSVALFLMQRARRDGGFERGIIYRADAEGKAKAYEIRKGLEREFPPHELKPA